MEPKFAFLTFFFAYIIKLLLAMGTSMFLHHTPLPKHGHIHVISTKGDPKAHEVAMCFQGHLYHSWKKALKAWK